MASESILTETSAGVLSITLNRPEVLNSVTAQMSADLLAVLNRASDDDAVRAVMVTGAGRGFCAGQDLAEATPGPDKPRQDFAAHVRKVYNPVVRTLRKMPKPVVAAVNGVAAGAGASLAFACDFIFASSQASFIQAFAKIGLVPDTGATFFLPRLVGTARATAMMMLGEKVTAQQALDYGMIYRVVEPEKLIEESRGFAAQLATQATFALGLTKRLINASASNDLDAQLEAEADLQGTAGRSADFQEGVAAFLGKRMPRFEGTLTPMAFSVETRIGVLGAGAMGSGIAQVAASAGHPVVLGDVNGTQLERARGGIVKAMNREVEKGRKTPGEAEAITARIETAPTGDGFAAFADCGFIIEAIAEDLAIKQQVFTALERVAHDATLGTNTSSLSVTAIASACSRPERVVGAHFFNPAPVMPLVEMIGGHGTDPARLAEARDLIGGWGKLTVTAADTPGFIVNRVARPYYNESLRLLEEGIADHATIDWAMKEFGGFRMGPFELMDLIGNDINYAVTRSVFEAFGYEPRYRPSLLQRRMVEAKLLGRKTGRGWYDYREGAVAPVPDKNEERGRGIAGRVVVMLINEAADAVLFQVATPPDVDRAMIKGVGYPKGLLEWADEIGIPGCVGRLAALQGEYGEDRYRPSALLRRMARLDQKFYP